MVDLDRAWRDAEIWADHADDYGVDCPLCNVTVTDRLSTIGDAIDAVELHIRLSHVPTVDGAIGNG
jgi:hypothetical protein